jgi:hypothetical protein
VDTNGDVVTETQTDDSGAFMFDNVMAGSGTTLLVSAPGYANADPLSVDLPSDTGLSVELYPLTPPVQVPPVIMPAPPPDGLAGMVRDATTQAGIGGASVQLVDDAGNVLAATTTDDGGTFTVNGLSVGTDTLLIAAPGYADADPMQVAVPSDTALAVTLAPVAPAADTATDGSANDASGNPRDDPTIHQMPQGSGQSSSLSKVPPDAMALTRQLTSLMTRGHGTFSAQRPAPAARSRSQGARIPRDVQIWLVPSNSRRGVLPVAACYAHQRLGREGRRGESVDSRSASPA